MKYEQDMTQGNLFKQIGLYSLPLMVTNVLQVLFNLADVAVVGQFAGPSALGSVGSTVILVSLFTGMLIGLSSGTNVLTALYIGQKDDKKIQQTVHTGAIISFIGGIIVMAFGIGFASVMLEMMNTKAELLAGAELYFRIYFLGMPALAMYNFATAVLNAIGDTKHPLYYLSFAGVVNILLNLLFVIAFKMDVAGVALASVISQYVSAGLVLRKLFKCKTSYGLKLKLLKIDGAIARRILGLGIPSALQYGIFQFANLFVQSGVNSFDAVIVEGTAAAANADGIIYEMMSAFYTACASFVSQNFGAKKGRRIIKSYFISMAYAFFSALFLGGLLLLFGRSFLAVFTNDAQVIEAGMYRIMVMGGCYCVSAFMDCTIAVSRGLGHTTIPTILVIMGSCVFRLIWVYTVFAYYGTITSLYLLYVFSWIITAFAEILYFIWVYKRDVKNLMAN